MMKRIAALVLLVGICLALTRSDAGFGIFSLGNSGAGGSQFNIPMARAFPWGNQAGFVSQTPPGVTYNAGIPLRSTIFATVTPCTQPCNDAVNINTAYANCAAAGGNQTVKLSSGTFIVYTTNNGNTVANPGPILLLGNNCTLRGAGPGTNQMVTPAGSVYNLSPVGCGAQWAGVSPPSCVDVFNPQGTGTFIKRGDYAFDNSTPVIRQGGNAAIPFPSGILFTADSAQYTNTVTLANTTGLSTGLLIYIDQITDNNSDVYFDAYQMPPASGNRCLLQNGHCQCPNAVTNAVTSSGAVLHFASTPSWAVAPPNPNPLGFPGSVIADLTNPGAIPGGTQIQSLTGTTVTMTNSVSGTVGNGDVILFQACARTISQVAKIASIVGNVVTLVDPLSYAFTVANAAMVSIPQGAGGTGFQSTGIGVEELSVFGGAGADGGGNIFMSNCESCWVRHVDCAWANGSCIGMYATYKSEVRDSYMHEAMYPIPGGGGYLSSINSGGYANLYENNIMWAGDKVNVMRQSGGGNVFGYNYMDDAFSATFPDQVEAGINAGHYTTPHYELLEGNYSHRYEGDSFWGNSIYITIFRNWLSGFRANAGSLPSYNDRINPNTFMTNPTPCLGGTSSGGIGPGAGEAAKYIDGYHVATDVQGGAGTTGFTTASATNTAGSMTVTVTSVPGFVVANGAQIYDTSARGSIVARSVVTGIAGNVLTLSNPLAGTVTSGDAISFMNIAGGGTTGSQLGTYANNFVGNVLGASTQMLAAQGVCLTGQTQFVTEDLTQIQSDSDYVMWSFGSWEDQGQFGDGDQFYHNNSVYTSMLRQGNWVYTSSGGVGSAFWYTNPIGSSGASTGSAQTLPSSLYLTSTPAFFTNYGDTWPWVDGPSGAVHSLPAKDRFNGLITGNYAPGANGPNACMNYDSTNGVCLD